MKLWNLRPYDKTNAEMTRVPRLTAAYHKVREETKDWGDYEKLPEAIPEFSLIGRMLIGAVSVVQTPRLRAFETNERRVGKFLERWIHTLWEGMPPCYSIHDLPTRIKRRDGEKATPRLPSPKDSIRNGRD